MLFRSPASDAPATNSKPKSNRGGSRPGAGRKSLTAQLERAIVNAFGAFPSAATWDPNRTYIYAPNVEPNCEHDQLSRERIAAKARARHDKHHGIQIDACRIHLRKGCNDHPCSKEWKSFKAVGLSRIGTRTKRGQ